MRENEGQGKGVKFVAESTITSKPSAVEHHDFLDCGKHVEVLLRTIRARRVVRSSQSNRSHTTLYLFLHAAKP